MNQKAKSYESFTSALECRILLNLLHLAFGAFFGAPDGTASFPHTLRSSTETHVESCLGPWMTGIVD